MRTTQGSRAMWTAAAVAGLIAAGAAPAQDMPRVSPRAKVEQRIGVTDVTVDYHRPGVKGREIWGALVPWGEPWRTGANERTKITFSTPVTIGGTELEAGSYGLATIPGQEKWTFVLSNVADAWGTFTYDPAQDAARVEVTPKPTAHTEWMDFDFANLTPSSADLMLRWEEVEVALPIQVKTDQIVARRVMGALSGGADYCAETGGCADAAESWAGVLTGTSPSFWSWRLAARLHAKQGETAEAAAAAQKALAAAEGMPSQPPQMYLDEMRGFARAEGEGADSADGGE